MGLVLILFVSGSASAVWPTPVSAPGAALGKVPHLEARLGVHAAFTTLNSTLTVNRSAVNLSSQFWGTTQNNEVRMFRGETAAVNATPARVLVWPGAMAGEDYDPFANLHYNTYNGTPTHALTSESQFVQLCKATHCIAIMQVPAEIDNAAFAEKIVNYTEVNLSFHPAYWMIGNEPELWQHWQVAWKDWGSTYTTGPDPTQFGNEVLAYVAAIRHVDNTTPILGLPASGCTCGYWTFAQWIYGVLKVTGSKIQAVAFHEYPAGWLGTGDGSLGAFYDTIQSSAGIPPRMVEARAAVRAACGTCNVSVLVSELGSALSWSTYGPYAFGFSGSLSLASQLIQAMDVNLTNVDLFATELATSNSWFSPTGTARTDYTLYSQIFDHLGSQAFSLNFTGLGHRLYGIDTIAPNDQGRRDLLVVNDNITRAVSFVPRFAGSVGNASVEGWSWNGTIYTTPANATTWVEPSTPNPVATEYPAGLPATYVLPPQSMVLFETYPSGGTYVRVNESGVPSPTPWYASVGSNFYTTTASNFSLLLPAGSYPVASVGIPLPIGGRELVPSEQLGPSVMSPAHVGGQHTNVTINFLPQWRFSAVASPAAGGSVTPAEGWWNAGQSLNLTAAPATGYAFVGWSGWGPGSHNGSGRTVTVVPTGRVVEKARFVVGQPVYLRESGLPAGTPWAVTIRGYTYNSSTPLVTVYEPNGTIGFSVHSIPGYRIIPRNGSFTVLGSWSLVAIKFQLIRPPGLEFPVTFRFSGLPAGTPVSIAVRGTILAGTFDPQFQLLNGSYAYRVGYVAGYHVGLPGKRFVVTGGPLTVDVPFVRTMYPVAWAASGSQKGMNWSVELNGTPIAATSAWATAALPNGSYSYAVRLPSNFSATPRTGAFTITGAAMKLYLVFSLLMFPAWFEASAPGAYSVWSVRFGNATHVTSANRSSFSAPNGTYTFDVQAPTGYYAVPSHGNLTVAGPMPPVVIQFHLSSNKPSAALVDALSKGALTVSIWIGASVFLGYASFRWMRRRDG